MSDASCGTNGTLPCSLRAPLRLYTCTSSLLQHTFPNRLYATVAITTEGLHRLPTITAQLRRSRKHREVARCTRVGAQNTLALDTGSKTQRPGICKGGTALDTSAHTVGGSNLVELMNNRNNHYQSPAVTPLTQCLPACEPPLLSASSPAAYFLSGLAWSTIPVSRFSHDAGPGPRHWKCLL